MPTAKIDDRTSIEGVYPESAFAEDAARNSVGDAQILFGLRIESGPDEHGEFALVRAKQHVGEQAPSSGAIFLAPEHQTRYAGLLQNDAAGTQHGQGADNDPAGEYAAFIERVIETAKNGDFPDFVGRGEVRLRGFRGG
jgi:hypothetical protein